jgi:hypothetical protein
MRVEVRVDATALARKEQAVGAPLLMLRRCERSEAIQNPSAEGLWIASLR